MIYTQLALFGGTLQWASAVAHVHGGKRWKRLFVGQLAVLAMVNPVQGLILILSIDNTTKTVGKINTWPTALL